ncbi:hydroxyacylglutathione hydrolase [Primorskyibacter sp. S187A]|uniref:hydroxyacylglutathione hydrolase n=1 Tax=Primorskyibacter sp. S187A TaxID=3415130 RepID=UPI003C7BADF0
MALDLVTIPCLSDNYAYLIHDAESGETALIDAPEAAPILAELQRRNWTLDHILLTHHHDDHTGAVADILAKAPAKVWGAAADAHRLPELSHSVQDGDTHALCGEEMMVMDVSGHTIGHVAFYFAQSGLLFSADSLMALGCGRLFEGTAAQMHASLSKLAQLPPDTLVCSGHEYATSNAAFARTIEPDNAELISRTDAIAAARAHGRATVPSTLSLELATNPFLRAHIPDVQAQIGMSGQDPVDVFAEIRARKDRF